MAYTYSEGDLNRETCVAHTDLPFWISDRYTMGGQVVEEFTNMDYELISYSMSEPIYHYLSRIALPGYLTVGARLCEDTQVYI